MAEALVQLYVDKTKVHEEARQRQEAAADIEAELDAIIREIREIDERIKDEEEGTDEREGYKMTDNDSPPGTQVDREGPPSPLTRSPVMYLGLLLGYGDMALMSEELMMVMEALAPSWLGNWQDDLMMIDAVGDRRSPARLASCVQGMIRTRSVLAGTDAHGLRLPPDGKRLFGVMEISKGLAGMDPLGFRHLPNGWRYGYVF